MPSYRVPIEDEVFRSMKVDNFSKTPYSDATQVCELATYYCYHTSRYETHQLVCKLTFNSMFTYHNENVHIENFDLPAIMNISTLMSL